MKIDDWYQEIKEQNIRLNTIQMGQVRESISLEGYSVTVSLGKQATLECGSWNIAIGDPLRRLSTQFAPLFRKYNDDFANLLDHIKLRVDEVVNAVNELFSAIVDQDIPELMLERMTGAQMGSEPQELIKKTTETRVKKLMARLEGLPKPFESLDWKKKIAKKELDIRYAGDWRLWWGDIHTPNIGNLQLTQCLLFLANYEKIMKAVEKFALAIEASAKILED